MGPDLSAAADASPLTAKFRRQLELRLERTHTSAQSIDLDGLLRELDQRAAAGESAASLAAWLDQELPVRWMAFAPVAPRVRPNPEFDLPFDPQIHWIVGQGTSGGSHRGRLQYALDFAMPEGTPILAAAPGTVARVVDGFARCCLPIERSGESNQVIVIHGDGTFSSYGHFRPGIPVTEGQPVAAGDLLGYSGNTGYSTMPHLHFEVAIRDASKQARTIPFRFRNQTAQGYYPKAWRLYQNRPPSSLRLAVSVKGQPLVSGQPFLLEDRAPVQLGVALADGSGESVDVTRDPNTRYVPLTPWSLRVGEPGRVVFGFQSSQWDPLPALVKNNVAILTILYQDPKGGVGAFDAWFRFPDAGRDLEKKSGAQPGG
jgi:murein DD-endopeptidase MepM/ murein hydrolase activator NlpD